MSFLLRRSRTRLAPRCRARTARTTDFMPSGTGRHPGPADRRGKSGIRPLARASTAAGQLPCRNHVPRGGPRHEEGQGPGAPACWFPHGRGRSTASVVICISLRPCSAMSPLNGDRKTGSTANAREQHMLLAPLAMDATAANGSSVARCETVSSLDFPCRRIFSKFDAVLTSRRLSATVCSKALRSQSDDTL